MRITSIEVQPLNLELQSALTVAYGSYPVLEYALLQIHTDDGLIGLGEASPDPEVTGETQAIVLAAFEQVRELLIGQDPFDIASILHACQEAIPHKPAVIGAIDMALYDLMGKSLKVPLYQLLGGLSQPGMDLYPVIPMDAPQVMAAMSKGFSDMGARTLKVKLGSDTQSDLMRLEAIHDAVGSEVMLRLDINQGWRDSANAIKVIGQLRPFNIEYIEQPIAARDIEGMATVTAAVEIPIMADESCHSPADVYRIAKCKAADWINIKLMKCGGITQARKMLAVAEAAGLPCMLGSMGESSIGSAAGLHFAVANSGIKACELIGPLFITNDPAEGYLVDQVTFRATPSDKPGLGVQLK
ncbi:MAG: dipeptide epimerase [Anaerolineaceae bacterium]|nr:dipeptide epimerase [Anaerolineaceae bacterium]